MSLQFRTIEPDQDRELLIQFLKDSHMSSFGEVVGFEEKAFLQRLYELVPQFPDGFVLVTQDGQHVGQMELRIKTVEEREIGYVSLYYITPDYRGRGVSNDFVQYAENFFRAHGMTEYHLRVSPTNARAIRFYEKHGMEKIAEEMGSAGRPMWRMRKVLA